MKILVGKVVSTKMQQSATVTVTQTWTHPKYKKTVKKSKRYIVDNQIKANEGDTVELKETRPLSKHKTFVISKIIESANQAVK
jgi:small subunit ribosomal protein S17